MNIRKKLAVAGGLIASVLVIMIFEWGGKYVYTQPAGLDYTDKAAMAQMVINLPLIAFIWLLMSYTVASFAGGLVSTLLSGRRYIRPAITVGIMLTVFGVVNLTKDIHPVWFAIISTLIYIPLSMLGYRVARREPLSDFTQMDMP